MFGFDFGSALARKYDILQQNANTEASRAASAGLEAGANANFTNVRAGLLPGQTAADINETKARTNQINVNANLAPGLAQASEASSYGAAARDKASALNLGAETSGLMQDQSALSKALGGDSQVLRILQYLRGYGMPSSTTTTPPLGGGLQP